MDYSAFLQDDKTFILSPAGHGKTHSIVECLKHCSGSNLILTHTHAGVASIKKKLKASGGYKDITIDTIASFAQRYVLSYVGESSLPKQDDKNYHDVVIEKSCEIFKSKFLTEIIYVSYSRIFIDEYQDCTLKQHDLIMRLSEITPVHIFGDPLQGIFDGLSGGTVRIPEDLISNGFVQSGFLEVPYRWYKDDNNAVLGDYVLWLRHSLRNGIGIDFSYGEKCISGFHYLKTKSADLYDPKSSYRKYLKRLVTSDSLGSVLIIYPEYFEYHNGAKRKRGGIDERAKFKATIDYGNELYLLESIDEKKFYSVAKKLDGLIDKVSGARNKIKKVKVECIDTFFNKNSVNEYFNETGLKKKKDLLKESLSLDLDILIQGFINNPSSYGLFEILENVTSCMNFKLKRPSLYFGIVAALKDSSVDGISIYEAIKNQRNRLRRVGRTVDGKVLATTLLTKGLEFDTVAIVDAHKFTCPKNFYVAISRCCKKLVVFSESEYLKFD